MMTFTSLHMTRERLSRLALALVLVAAPGALAGDRPAPETFIDSGPELITPSTTADFVFRSNLAGAEFWCSLDEGEYLPCERTHRVEGLGVGPHVLLVYAHDPISGLTDTTPAFWEWTVEEGAPPMDAGSPGGDAGTRDAGVPGDGGAPELDGGTSGGQDAGPGPDGGTSGGQDAGSPGGSDAGTSGNPDAGSHGGSDAGTSGNPDAGTSTGGDDAGPGDIEDAGSPDGGDVPPGDSVPPEEALDYLGGGVGCTGAPAPSAVAGLLLLVLAIRRRRR